MPLRVRVKGVRVVAVTGAVLALRDVEPTRDAGKRFRGDFHAGHLGTLDCHQVPAGDGGVGFLLRAITPATALRMLRLKGEGDRFFERTPEFFVPGHSVGFAESDGGDSVGVELGVKGLIGLIVEESTILLLVGDEPSEAGVYLIAVLVIDVRVAFAQEGKERQPCGSGIGIHRAEPRVGRRGNDARRQAIDGPAAVRELAAGQEVEPLLDRPIGALCGSMLSCHFVPRAREALLEGSGRRFHQGGVEGRTSGGTV